MGVMTCDRSGCHNIMCDRYSDKHGYICEECFSEMEDSGMSISIFMNTPKEEPEEDDFDYEGSFPGRV